MVYKCFEPPPYLHAFNCLLPKHRVTYSDACPAIVNYISMIHYS
jgi:hypothetical protein